MKRKNLGTLSFFCDESCYQLNDKKSHMAIAAVWCRKDRKKEINNCIYTIKEKYKITKNTELKWGKVSNATLEMYKEIFTEIKKNKYIRITIEITNKEKIKKDAKSRWYDTMYYNLIEFPIHQVVSNYNIENVEIFSDVMDTHSIERMEKISTFLRKHFKNKINYKSKVCESKDVQLIQVADLLAGAATYANRQLETSNAKKQLIEHIQNIFGINLKKTTKIKYGKISSYNVFLYDPEEKNNDF